MFKFITKTISDLLGFSKTEAKGTLVLIFIVLLGIGVLIGLPHFFEKNEQLDANQAEKLNAWVNEARSKIKLKQDNKDVTSKYKKVYKKQNYKAYNYSKKKYTNNDKKQKRDSIYSINKSYKNEAKPNKIIVLDINKATAEQLKKVRGVGKKLSVRIIKFRDRLGGFYSMNQLKEVYGLENEIIEKTKKHFSIQSKPKKIILNTDSLKLLASHPYISWKLAKVIIRYRKMHGNYDSPEKLQKIGAIKAETFSKLKPYLE